MESRNIFRIFVEILVTVVPWKKKQKWFKIFLHSIQLQNTATDILDSLLLFLRFTMLNHYWPQSKRKSLKFEC